MHSSRHNALAHLLHILGGTSSLASALSLSNFDSTASPGALSAACQAVFNAAIPACTVSDFEPAPACSKSCLAGLEQINAQVAFACSTGSSVDPNSLLGAFVAGQGIQLLCNVVVTTTTAVPRTTTLDPAAAPPTTMATAAVPAAATPLSSPAAAAPGSAAPQPSTTMTVAAPAASSRPPSSSRSASAPAAGRTGAGPASGVAAANPSRPTCSGGGTVGDGGSPFDAFSDQLCAKSRSGASSLRAGRGWRAVGFGAVGWAVAWAVS
jgi:hypothetical protein